MKKYSENIYIYLLYVYLLINQLYLKLGRLKLRLHSFLNMNFQNKS